AAPDRSTRTTRDTPRSHCPQRSAASLDAPWKARGPSVKEAQRATLGPSLPGVGAQRPVLAAALPGLGAPRPGLGADLPAHLGRLPVGPCLRGPLRGWLEDAVPPMSLSSPPSLPTDALDLRLEQHRPDLVGHCYRML